VEACSAALGLVAADSGRAAAGLGWEEEEARSSVADFGWEEVTLTEQGQEAEVEA